MDVVLLFVRSYRGLSYQHVAACCICHASSSSWKWHSRLFVSSATDSTGIGSASFDPGGKCQERQKRLWEDLFLTPSEWWDYRVSKTSPRYPDFRHKRTREPLWLDNPDKPDWVDCKLVTLDAQSRSGLEGSDKLQILCEEGQVDQALDILMGMDRQGTVPSVHLYRCVLKACAKKKALVQAKRLNALLAKHGLDSTRYVGEYLVNTLVKCGGLEDAVQLFERLPLHTSFSWTALISGYTMAGQGYEALRMYHCMREQGMEPNEYTFASLLKACGSIPDIKEGKRIHADTWRYRCETDLFVGTCLLDMYIKCGSVIDAQNVFDRLSERSVVSWTAMLAGYAQQGQPEKALELYEQMQEDGVSSDDRTFVSVVQACGTLADKAEEVLVDGLPIKAQCLVRGKAIHADARRKGHDTDAFVGSTLVSMYGKCGSIVDAHNVFSGLSQRNVVLWTAIFAAYAQHGQAEKALQLYEQMQVEGASPDVRSFVSALQACGMHADNERDVVLNGRSTKVKSLDLGKAIHAICCMKGCHSDVFVGNALVSMYGRCGSIMDAQYVFSWLSERDVVSWNAMLAVYVDQGQEEKALHLYPQMQEEGVSPNEITMMCLLQACGNLGSLDICRQVHHTFLGTRNDLSPGLASSLIHAYGRCASMVDAQTVFDGLPRHHVAPWTSLIAGYARQGNSATSLQLFEEMLMAGLKPNGVTFLAVLSACSHAGLVDQGVEYFESMSRDHGITPEIDHYVSMVDLLGRSGYFTMVENLISTMPIQPNVSIWLCLLGACRKYGKVALAEVAFQCAVRYQPKYAALYLLMSNIYSQVGMWEKANEVHTLEQKADAWKKPPGQTWIEDGQGVHNFLVGCDKALHQEDLYDMLGNITVGLDKRE